MNIYLYTVSDEFYISITQFIICKIYSWSLQAI